MTNLPRRPTKVTGWARRALFRKAACRPMITLEELQRPKDLDFMEATNYAVFHSKDMEDWAMVS